MGIKVYPSYTRWAHVYISNTFPCLTQFAKKLDLGRFYIQVLNYDDDDDDDANKTK